ncbi:MAG TPA: hypothetical protein VHT97_03585 [Acidimicrobiales bacterium]|jgi:hypothetical protein|nr:hypothetical protein [Acidimicrobiales bacterium]
MRRYLVVANRTLLGDPSLGRLKECLAAGACQFHRISRTFGLPVSTVGVAAKAPA